MLHRSTRSIALTPEDTLFLKRCQAIFSEIEAAEIEIARSSAEPRGKLRVSLPLIGMLMMPSIAVFTAAYPAIELDLDFTDRLVDVIEEGLDAVVRTGQVSDSRLKMRKLGTYSYVIVGSAAHFARRGISETARSARTLTAAWRSDQIQRRRTRFVVKELEEGSKEWIRERGSDCTTPSGSSACVPTRLRWVCCSSARNWCGRAYSTTTALSASKRPFSMISRSLVHLPGQSKNMKKRCTVV